MPDTTRDKLRSCLLACSAILAQITKRHPLHQQAAERVTEIDALLAAKAGRPGKLDLAEVSRLAAEGKTTSQIAAELGVTYSAVFQAKQKL